MEIYHFNTILDDYVESFEEHFDRIYKLNNLIKIIKAKYYNELFKDDIVLILPIVKSIAKEIKSKKDTTWINIIKFITENKQDNEYKTAFNMYRNKLINQIENDVKIENLVINVYENEIRNIWQNLSRAINTLLKFNQESYEKQYKRCYPLRMSTDNTHILQSYRYTLNSFSNYYKNHNNGNITDDVNESFSKKYRHSNKYEDMISVEDVADDIYAEFLEVTSYNPKFKNADKIPMNRLVGIAND